MLLKLVGLILGCFAACVVAQTTQPAVALPSRNPGNSKVLYYPMSWDVSEWAAKPNPAGTMPYVVVGGGLYQRTPELSYFVGGYWGEGATPGKPSSWDKRWQTFDLEKVQQAFSKYPAGMPYVLNVEHWPTDIRTADTWTVENSIRKFRSFYREMRVERPDLRGCLYAVVPINEYTTCTNYGIGMDAWAKLQFGEAMSAYDVWALSGVATKDASGVYRLDDNARFTKPFRALQAANDRLTYGLTSAGKPVSTQGLVDALDYLCVSAYDHKLGFDSDFYLKHSIAEARRVGGRKKVYVFLSPRYVAGPNAKQAIPQDEWRHTVLLAFVLADGVMIWDDAPIDPERVNDALEMKELAER